MAKKVTLQQLERLGAEGRDDELLLALKQSRFEDLRALLGALGVKVRTKEYAAYRSKDDHVQLLAEVLQRKAAGMDAPVVPREVTPVKRTQQMPPKRSTVDRVGGTPMSSQDAERAYLVQCINVVDDALTNAETKKEHVSGLKRTLTCELAYFVKRLKRIQEKDVNEEDDKA